MDRELASRILDKLDIIDEKLSALQVVSAVLDEKVYALDKKVKNIESIRNKSIGWILTAIIGGLVSWELRRVFHP